MNSNFNLDSLLARVEKPARYIGGEPNSCMKEVGEKTVRFGFAFPDMYEIGMSYLGMQIIYNLLNKREDVYCERIFSPAPDMEKLLREEDIPLFTLETKLPIPKLDVLGFTLQYEMSFTNILNILDLAKIPLRSADRSDDMPLVIAGGPCAYNPEPLAEIVDIFLIGDGEEVLPTFFDEFVKSASEGENRKQFFERISGIAGVYIPSLYEVTYKENGEIKDYIPKEKYAPKRIVRAISKSLEELEFPENPIVPIIEVVHDRAVVETFRGCTRGCRFCQAGMIYRPVRERSTEKIRSLAQKQLRSTGHEELSLLSLSTSDYMNFEELATGLMKTCKDDNVSLSLPSLRLDSFSFKVLEEIQGYKKSGLTFAPEAGTQRLRDVINKGITENDIYSAVEQAIELGWRNVKLYFMNGLPTETYEDLDGIFDIAKNIIDINFKINGKSRFNVTVSASNFVPKAHTPFQWMSQDTKDEFMEKHYYLKDKFKTLKGASYNYHETDTSILEAVFARGDRRVCDVIIRAFELGCRFDGWTEHFKKELWEQAFSECNISKEFYAHRQRSYDEVLPWDIIDSGITKEFLIKENEKAIAEQTTHDCRYGCVNCGINAKVKCELGGVYA